MDHECIEKVEKKNAAHKTYLERPTRMKRKEYEEARREAKRIFRSKKRKYLNALVLQMEQDFKRDNLREAYRAMNLFKKGYISRSTICRNKERAMVAGKKNVLNRWREYFDQLLNPNPAQNRDQPNEPMTEEEDTMDPPSMEQVRRVIGRLKNNKAP